MTDKRMTGTESLTPSVLFAFHVQAVSHSPLQALADARDPRGDGSTASAKRSRLRSAAMEEGRVKEIFNGPLLDLVFRSASVHRQHHDPSKVQLCTLMNIKSEFGIQSQI
jgi:hypothetical protein